MSSPFRTIQPDWRPDGGLAISARELNTVKRQMYADTYGFYQNAFKLFSYMNLNSRGKYVVHTPKSHPLMWQEYKACSYTETGSLTMDSRELEPDPIYFKEGLCHDELMGSIYEHFIQYTSGGDVTLDANGMALFDQFFDEILTNAELGLRAGWISGRLYDVDSIAMSDDNDSKLSALFRKTHGSIKGILKLFLELAAAGKEQLNVQGLVSDSQFDEVSGFTGDIFAVLDGLKAKAKAPMKRLINQGGVIRNAGYQLSPVIVLSDSYFQAVVSTYLSEGKATATNRTRLTKRMIGGNETTPLPNFVYYLDDVLPIVPLEEINIFDRYIKGQTHFAGILASGVIQFGSNFVGIDSTIENRGVGVMMRQVDDITRNDYGRYVMLSHAIQKVAIADPDYIVATQSYTEPA